MMTKKRNKVKRFFLILSLIITTFFVAFVISITVIYNQHKLDIDKLTSVNNGIKVSSSTGNNETLYNTNRSIVAIETLPEYVKNAFIDVEDKRFYSHNGYDIKRIIKSFFVNLKTQSKSQGASTISQQLIKNTILSNEKTYQRKIKEIVLAIKLEKNFSKEEILEMYLNTIYFGSNAYGIENASKIYFNKSAKDLSKNEACLLAGIIKSPAKYSPKYNHDNATQRKNLVAKTMLKAKHLNMQEYNDILLSPIDVFEQKSLNNAYEEEAIYQACELLNITERELINLNYEIITFKNDALQEEVMRANNNVVSSAENKTNSTLDSLSLLASNDGKILAYYANSNYNLHNLRRQPASTLKPLAVYLPCFEHNILSPASLILDEKINYSGYEPKNADNTFHGYVSCREALSCSYNIPAVKALDYLGVKKSKEMLDTLGINLSNSDLNLTLALGSIKNGVDIMDLLSAYLTLANMGTYKPLTFIDKIIDNDGRIIYSHEDYSAKVVGDDSCYLINDILKDCAQKGTAKRLESLHLPIASKTGTASTSNGNTDLYNIAYSSEHTLLTWIADIDKNVLPSSLLSAIEPTQVNKDILSVLYENKKPQDFIKPSNIEYLPYDLVEAETNHIIVQPNHTVERYISYDYFKSSNIPQTMLLSKETNFEINLEKSGATITLDAKRNKTYSIIKKTNDGVIILDSIKNRNGLTSLLDPHVFQYESIDYYICDDNNNIISSQKTIRPKDFLISMLNNEIINNKKKWLVSVNVF